MSGGAASKLKQVVSVACHGQFRDSWFSAQTEASPSGVKKSVIRLINDSQWAATTD